MWTSILYIKRWVVNFNEGTGTTKLCRNQRDSRSIVLLLLLSLLLLLLLSWILVNHLISIIKMNWKCVGKHIQVGKFKSIILGAVYKHPNTNYESIAYLERMLQTNSNCEKMFMLGDLNEDLLKANRLEQILDKLNIFQLIKKLTRVTPTSKTLIGVIITNSIEIPLCKNKHLSRLPTTMLSAVWLSQKQRITPFKINDRIYANYSPVQIKLIQLSNHLGQMYETESVDAQVKILTMNFLLALDSWAQCEMKLIKRQPHRWIKEAIWKWNKEEKYYHSWLQFNYEWWCQTAEGKEYKQQ